MSLQEILMILGIAALGMMLEELLGNMWNARVARRRQDEEEAKLQRIERIIADARMTGTQVIVEDNRAGIEEKALSP